MFLPSNALYISLTLIIIVIIARIFYHPQSLKKIVYRCLIGSSPQYYDLSPSGKEFNDEYGAYTLYQNEGHVNRTLLIWFGGGGFLFSDRRLSYGFLNELRRTLESVDILIFDYPVRFRNTVHDALIAIDRLVSAIVTKHGYTSFFTGAASTGALLMGAYVGKQSDEKIAKEINVPFDDRITVQGMIGICGMYTPRFKSRAVTALFDFYIMRGTRKPQLYSCYNLLNVPKLIIASHNDILRHQTYEFISRNSCEKVLFSNSKLPQNFSLLLNLKETSQTVLSVGTFLRRFST